MFKLIIVSFSLSISILLLRLLGFYSFEWYLFIIPYSLISMVYTTTIVIKIVKLFVKIEKLIKEQK